MQRTIPILKLSNTVIALALPAVTTDMQNIVRIERRVSVEIAWRGVIARQLAYDMLVCSQLLNYIFRFLMLETSRREHNCGAKEVLRAFHQDVVEDEEIILDA